MSRAPAAPSRDAAGRPQAPARLRAQTPPQGQLQRGSQRPPRKGAADVKAKGALGVRTRAPAPKGFTSDALPISDSYWVRSELPLTGLLFLLPLMIVYQWGLHAYGQGPIIAYSFLQQFCMQFNLRDSRLPALIVVVAMLGTHVANQDRWRVMLGDLPVMAVESIVLAMPLLVMWYAAGPYLARFSLFSNPPAAATIPCIGAGIYEEFVFRLVGLNLMSFFLIDLMEMNRGLAIVLMVLISSIAFSAYHYLGAEQFSTITFIFRFLAGAYFATVFLCRGYAVTCGAHASYDILIVLLHFAR